MPKRNTKSEVRKYLIRDDGGSELGESEGGSKVEALRNLYRLANMRISEADAMSMVTDGRARFQVLA
jgi:hypothetical protein